MSWIYFWINSLHILLIWEVIVLQVSLQIVLTEFLFMSELNNIN